MPLWPTGSWRIFVIARNLPPLPSHSAGHGWTADSFSCLLLELANVLIHSFCAWFTVEGVNCSLCFPSEHEWLWKEGNLECWESWPALQNFTDLKTGLQLTCAQRISLLDITGCVFTVEQVAPEVHSTFLLPYVHIPTPHACNTWRFTISSYISGVLFVRISIYIWRQGVDLSELHTPADPTVWTIWGIGLQAVPQYGYCVFGKNNTERSRYLGLQ